MIVLLSLLLSAPTAWALLAGNLDPASAILRFLCALLLAALGERAFHTLLSGYGKPPEEGGADPPPEPRNRRRTDQPGAESSGGR